MRIVVADTTPIRYLAEIGQLELLPRLFGTVFIPSVVYRELQHPSTPAGVREALSSCPSWLKVVSVPMPTDPSLDVLDEGEKAAISLGIECAAQAILIDERRGAAIAREKGFEVTGTLGILLLAAQRGLVDMTSTLEQIRGTSFRYSEKLLQELITRSKR